MGKKAKFGAITPPKRDKPRKRPGRHSKKPNKKRRKKPYNGQGRAWQNPKISYIVGMKDKILTLKAKGITPKQWSALILELNIMRKEWKPYGVDIQLSAPSIKKIIALGTNAVKDKRTGQYS